MKANWYDAQIYPAFFDKIKRCCTGLSILDSTPLKVCHNLRIRRHKVFKNTAERGKSSTGWFFMALSYIAVINHLGELLGVQVTTGNTDDRKPVIDLCSSLSGTVYADKGYISKALSDTLKADYQISPITKTRKNMKPKKLSSFDKAMLRYCSIVETVFDELKNLCQIEHSKHHSPANFMVNLVSGLIAYCFQDRFNRLLLSR